MTLLHACLLRDFTPQACTRRPCSCGKDTMLAVAGSEMLKYLASWLTAFVPRAAVCPNSLANDDPKCQNGGRLHANNSTMEGEEYYANCALCDCPDGWAGFDCSGTPRVNCVGTERPQLQRSQNPLTGHKCLSLHVLRSTAAALDSTPV